ncbi:Glu-tRNA(Gln) amidotransferase subunit GatD [Methanogenium marinum]|uniref:Glutamyl-tRNA(Gln) amidotransferase subunit D n=1 Tax=Methanogenium marinum TaxID=348610 RepID=A0A9Q4KS76_9EURY|nr:Glu-tRNA(Gln) amidotransferase subunit GatD [Methanogenium marinum]MDE4907772.1 Glu-tRNA(Gln) amidotransferase subunit GatD [Methanogenium marinum]
MESGTQVVCRYAGTDLAGTYITDRDGMAVIKLISGYNIGVDPTCLTVVAPAEITEGVGMVVEQDTTLPQLSIISTGGTIASRVDYRTGAVTSQFTADDIMRAIPGLADIAQFRSEVLATILSENMTPAIWQTLATSICNEIKNGAEGVMVTHGTDTLAYSAAAVSFMLDTPVPVVFVGSQRSADRPSSDNVMNGLASAAAATSDLGEVTVVMHSSTNDDTCAIHRGTRVRKMHTSRRDAFQSIGMAPVGSVAYPSLDVTLSKDAVRRRPDTEPVLSARLEEKVGLVTFYPGMNPDVIHAFDGYRGLVVSGTGLGHTSVPVIEALRSLTDAGTVVVMTSQCLNGRVCDRVYDTGRDLLAAGVVEGEDMLPEVAYVKLMWVLGQTTDTEEAARLMATPLRGEFGRCSYNGF